MNVPYSRVFYETYVDESLGSAREVVPLIVNAFQPRSVVDVGCGIGTWLSVFRELGVQRTVGIDGAYVSRHQFLGDPASFIPLDLSQPLTLAEHFDLALSMEVAEHISPEFSDSFVDSLAQLSDVIVFSAAIPHQGGLGHVNEQWPEYWIRRFADRGFLVFDFIRDAVWSNANVAYYYAQNCFVFVKEDKRALHPVLASYRCASPPYARVHPARWLEANDKKRQLLRPLLRALPYALAGVVARRISRLRQRRRRAPPASRA